MQCLIGDSAFENTPHVVSAFRKPCDSSVPKKQEQFNEKLACLRIISEHCIGMLKGRFPWLRSIRLLITEEKKLLTQISHLVQATVVLHNILIEAGKMEKREWIDEDDAPAIDDEDRVPVLSPVDILNQGTAANAVKDERRKRLTCHFEEHFHF